MCTFSKESTTKFPVVMNGFVYKRESLEKFFLNKIVDMRVDNYFEDRVSGQLCHLDGSTKIYDLSKGKKNH